MIEPSIESQIESVMALTIAILYPKEINADNAFLLLSGEPLRFPGHKKWPDQKMKVIVDELAAGVSERRLAKKYNTKLSVLRANIKKYNRDIAC